MFCFTPDLPDDLRLDQSAISCEPMAEPGGHLVMGTPSISFKDTGCGFLYLLTIIFRPLQPSSNFRHSPFPAAGGSLHELCVLCRGLAVGANTVPSADIPV